MDAARPHSNRPDEAALKEENRRIRRFRFLTDLTVQRLCVERLTLQEAREIVDGLRRTARVMFPGKEEVFDLVIAPRLGRIIGERFFPGN